MRNAVSQYGIVILRIPGTKSANLVQTIEKVIKKGGDLEISECACLPAGRDYGMWIYKNLIINF